MSDTGGNSEGNPGARDDDDLQSRRDEIAGIAYQVAVDLWGTLVVSSATRFNTMLLANTALISAIILIIPNYNSYKNLLLLALFLSAMGLLLTIIWYSMMERDSKFQKLYSVSARNLERRLSNAYMGKSLADPQPIETILNGARLTKRWAIKYPDEHADKPDVDKTNKEDYIQISRLGKLTIGENIRYIIIIFMIIFISLIGTCTYLYFSPINWTSLSVHHIFALAQNYSNSSRMATWWVIPQNKCCVQSSP